MVISNVDMTDMYSDNKDWRGTIKVRKKSELSVHDIFFPYDYPIFDGDIDDDLDDERLFEDDRA